MNEDDALGLIQEARAMLLDEAQSANTRELAMVVTKLDEAEMWRRRGLARAPRREPVSGTESRPAANTTTTWDEKPPALVEPGDEIGVNYYPVVTYWKRKPGGDWEQVQGTPADMERLERYLFEPQGDRLLRASFGGPVMVGRPRRENARQGVYKRS